MGSKVDAFDQLNKVRSGDQAYALRDGTTDKTINLVAAIQNAASGAMLFANLRVIPSVSGNALTLDLKQADGTDLSVDEPGFISFRNSSGNGARTLVTVTSNLSVTIPSGATMGHASGVPDFIHVYVMNQGSGVLQLCVSTEDLWSEDFVWDSTVLNTASDLRTVLYSPAAETGRPIRFAARIDITETTAGTWASNATRTSGASGDRSGVISAAVGQSGAVSLSTGVTGDITTIPVPPGWWDVSAEVGFIFGSSTSVSIWRWGLGTASATIPSAGSAGELPTADGRFSIRPPLVNPTVFNTTNPQIMPAGPYRVYVPIQTTFYLAAAVAFTVSTAMAFGWVQFRRAK